MAKIFLQLLFFSACFGICGIGESASQCGELSHFSIKGDCLSVCRPICELAQSASTRGSSASWQRPLCCVRGFQHWTYPGDSVVLHIHRRPQIPVKNSFSAVQNFPFTIKSTVFLWANILTTVTSTLTIERLSAAYVGAYACTAVAGDIKVGSDVFQVLLSGRLRC